MLNKYKKASMTVYVLAVIISVIFFVLTTFIGGSVFLGGHSGKLAIVFLLYFAASAYIQYKYKNNRYILLSILLLPPLIVAGIVIIQTRGSFPAFSLPSTLAYFIGAFLGWITAYQSKKVAALTCMVSMVVVGWMSMYGYDLYLHHLNYDNFYGSIAPQPVPKSILFKNEHGENTLLSNAQGLVILDVWNNGCGICFEKFPKFEALYRNYQDRQDMKFYAVNVSLRQGDSTVAKRIIREWDYTFPNLFLEDKQYADALGVKGYPSVLIVKDDSIVFKGSIDNVERIINTYNKETSKK